MFATRFFIALVTLSLLGCGGKEVGLVEPGDNGRDGMGGNGGPNDGMPMYLQAVDQLPLQAEATWSVPLRVKLKHGVTHADAFSESVSFEIKSSPDSNASLSSLTAITDQTGTATVDLRLGVSSGQAVVTVTHPDSGPLDINVDIGAATTGNIRVDIRAPGNAPVALAPFRIAFFPSAQISCSNYQPRLRQPEPVAEAHVPDTTQPVVQSGFAASTPFTVIVEAMGSGALTLAAGCVDGISVQPAETKVADVQLTMVPIQPAGTYDVESTWDVSEAIASQNGTTGALVRVIEFMANPGQAIYDIVLEEVEDAVGFGLDILLDIAGIKDRVINYINGQLNRSATVETFSAISADLSTMLNELKVTSQLTIAKTDNDFNFTGREEWTAVEVSWTWKCEDRQSNGCESHVVDLTEAGAAAGAVSYEWTGHVEDYDGLVIESHAAQIDIGRLQMYLLEQVILPDITNGNANSIADALVYWIDCDTLASRALQGQEICDPTGFFCAGQPEAAAACEAAIGYLAGYITEPLSNLQSNLDIELSGRAKLVDGDANGITDQIDDGVTTGVLAGSTEPVRVQWSGVVAP